MEFRIRHDVHIYMHGAHEDEILSTLKTLAGKVEHVTQATDNLKAAIARQGTVIASAVTAIRGFPALVGEAVRKALEAEDAEDADTEAAVNEATATAESQTAELVAALTEGTQEPPADPTDPATDPNAPTS